MYNVDFNLVETLCNLQCDTICNRRNTRNWFVFHLVHKYIYTESRNKYTGRNQMIEVLFSMIVVDIKLELVVLYGKRLKIKRDNICLIKFRGCSGIIKRNSSENITVEQ